MPTTEVAVVERVEAVLESAGFRLAVWDDFTKTPQGEIDRACTVKYTGTAPLGHMHYSEEARGTVEIGIARLTNSSQRTARMQLLTDIRTVLNAVVRDGTEGQYAVDDAARSQNVEFPKGANHGVGLLRLPVNFEAAL